MDGGYVHDRVQAESLILAGSVFVNGQQAAYAGEPVKVDARIAVKGSERKYVGKGGLKLEGAGCWKTPVFIMGWRCPFIQSKLGTQSSFYGETSSTL